MTASHESKGPTQLFQKHISRIMKINDWKFDKNWTKIVSAMFFTTTLKPRFFGRVCRLLRDDTSNKCDSFKIEIAYASSIGKLVVDESKTSLGGCPLITTTVDESFVARLRRAIVFKALVRPFPPLLRRTIDKFSAVPVAASPWTAITKWRGYSD